MTENERSELLALYNLWDLHIKMHAYEQKWYYQLIDEPHSDVLKQSECHIIDAIGSQSWFGLLFLTSIDYCNALFYPRCSDLRAIKQYIRDLIDIIRANAQGHTEREQQHQFPQRFCFEAQSLSVFKCPSASTSAWQFISGSLPFCSTEEVCFIVKVESLQGFALKIGLKTAGGLVVPFIESFLFDSDKSKAEPLCTAHTSIQKLSYLLFDVMDRFQNVKEFRRQTQRGFVQKIVNKLKEASHKYTGDHPDYNWIIKQSKQSNPSLTFQQQQLIRCSNVRLDPEWEDDTFTDLLSTN